MKHFLFNLTKNTAKEARITGGGASQVGNNSDLSPRLVRLDSVSILSRQSDLRTYVGRIAAILVLVLTIGIGQMWGTDNVSKIVFKNSSLATSYSATKITTLPASVGDINISAETFTFAKAYVSSSSTQDSAISLSSDAGASYTEKYLQFSSTNTITNVKLLAAIPGSTSAANEAIVGWSGSPSDTPDTIVIKSIPGKGTSTLTDISFPESKGIKYVRCYRRIKITNGKFDSKGTNTGSNTTWAIAYAQVTTVSSGADKDYTVTAATSTGDNTYGTVAASASSLDERDTTTITATPATGYQVTNWAVSDGDNGASISPNGASNSNTTKLTMGTANATVTATFGPKSYTVTLNNQSATTAGTVSVTTTYNANTNLTSAITKPTKTGYVFAGYFTDTNGTGIQLIDPAGNWIASAGGGSTYTDGSKNWKYDNSLTLYACWMEYCPGMDMAAQAISLGSGEHKTWTGLTTNKILYLVAGNTTFDDSSDASNAYDGLKFKNNGDYILFLVQANSSLKLYFGYTDTKPKISINGGAESTVDVGSTGSKTPNQEVDFGTQTYDRLIKLRTVTSNTVVLQKIEITAAAPSCSDDTGLAYGIGTVNKVYGDASFTNTLTNSNSLSVTYSSSNTDVATVNPSTGAVTIKAAGTATIKATWAGDATYCEDEVSYTLNVKPAVGEVSGAWDRFGGETISLSVTPSGGSSYTYQWQKYNGSGWDNVSNGTVSGATTTGATEANLQIANCGGGNSGTYRCSVTSAGQTNETPGYQVKVYVLECYNGGTTVYNFTRDGENLAGSLTIDLDASTAYEFKVHADNDYYGNNGTINSDATNWVLCNSEDEACTTNLTVNSGLGGTFTFAVEYSASGNSSKVGEPEISVTYPRKRIYLDPGVWDADGAKFAYNYWRDGVTAQWTDFLTSDDCGMYADIPQWNGVTIIPARLNSSTVTPGSWEDRWNQTDNITITSNDYIQITGWEASDFTYTTYSTPTYTISYNKGTSGSGTKSDETKTCGVDFTLPSSAVFTREGYLQTGWTTSDGGAQTHALGGSYTTNDDQTFYPVWTVQSYNLTWNLAGGTTTSAGTGIASGVSVNTTSSVAYGTSLTAPTVTKANYDFSAWSPAVASTMPAAATTYAATWTAQTHDVAFTLSNAAYSSGTDEGSDVATYGTNYSVTFAATSGYIFPSDITVTIGGETKTKDTHYTWDSSTGELTVTGSYITGDIAVSITALEDVYTVTYAAGVTLTSGSAPDDVTDLDNGDQVTIADNTGEMVYGSNVFRGWTDGTTFYLPGDKITISGSDVELTAVWDEEGGGNCELVDIDFTESGWSSLNTTETAQTLTIGSQTVYVRANKTDYLPTVDTSTGTYTFSGRNFSNKDCYLAIPVDGVNGSLTISVANGASNARFTYAYATSSTVTNPSAVTDVAAATPASVTLADLEEDFYMIYIGRQGSSYTTATSITITTPCSSSNFTVSFADGNTAPASHTTWPDTIKGVPTEKKILQPANPTAPNYTFGGWYTDAACTSAFSFSGTITKDTTLYAKWTEKSTPTKFGVKGVPVGLCGAETATITLTGSQSGVSYQLKKNGTDTLAAKDGTGSSLNWAGMPAGVYTIWTVENSTYKGVQMDKTDSTTVTVTDLTPASVSGITSSPVAANTNILTSLTVTATGDDLEYQWQTCTDDTGTGAADLTSGSEYSGFTGATLSITATSAGTRYFRCKVSGTCGDPVYSDVVTVNITASYLLTYDANNGSGAPDAEYRVAGSAALSSTVPTRSGYRFLGWNTEDDGSGTRYAAGASFTMGTSAVTLYAEWQEVATLTWTLTTGTGESSVSTSNKTSTNSTRISTSNMSNLSNSGLTITNNSKSDYTVKIEAPATKNNDKYMYVTFVVADDYELVPSAVTATFQPVDAAASADMILSDTHGHSISLLGASCSKGSANEKTITNGSGVAFSGTVTLKIYCYGSSVNTYRLGSTISIAGDINYVCPERPTITSPTAPQSIKLYTDQSKTLTVAATAYSSGTLHYQWKKDGVNIVGATSASHTVYGSIDGTAGETYVYTCDVTQTSPDACATVTSPAVSITFASTSCGYTEIASAVLTSKTAADRVNATLLVNGLADISSGSCKLNGAGAYFGLQLASGSFEVGDSIEFKIKKNNSTDIYLFATTDTAGLQTTDAIYTQSVTDGDNIIKFVVTSGSMLTALNTSKKVAVVRRTKDGVLNQNHSVYYVKVKRYGCPDIFIYDDAAGTHEWSDDDNWIGPAGHGSGLPTSDDRIFINKSVTVDVATASAAEMHITNGSMVTVEKSITVGDVIIETGSTLNIAKDGDDGITVATNSLYLKGGWNSSYTSYDMPRIYIDPASTLTKEVETVNLDISVDSRNYYPIAVPFRVKVSDVDYANSFLAGYSNYGVTGQYVIKEYDGERRAEEGPDQVNNWKEVPQKDDENKDVYLEPGRGYIMTAVSLPAYGGGVIRFPLSFTNDWTALGEQGTIDMSYYKNVVSVTAYTGKATEGDKNANKGWNLLGVPFMSCYGTGNDMTTGEGAASIIQGKFNFEDGTWDGEDPVRYVNVPVHDFSEYIQTDITDAKSVLRPGWCFFVQIDTTGNLKFLTADQAASSSLPIYAPRREQTMPTVETGIILSDGEKSDKTTFLVSDKYSATEYEINADLEKLFGNGYTLATYSLSGATRLAYNALSNADAANIIPIGYRAPADGEYTFSINPRYAESDAFEHINLIDYTTGIVTDLLQSSYTFSTERTQNDARFALNVVPRQETPTDLEDVQGGDVQGTKVRKMIINDQLFIIRDGQMYDATGRMVK